MKKASTLIDVKMFPSEERAYIYQVQKEMDANEKLAIESLCLKYDVTQSKLNTIITNIRAQLKENKYTCPEYYALELMQSAFKNLLKDEALQFLEDENLARNVIKPLLFKELINEASTQLSTDELINQCNDVKNLLESHKNYIIQTGLLPVTLHHLPWLESVFLRFYNTKITNSKWPSEPPKPPFVFLKSNLIPVLKQTDCTYEEADRIYELSAPKEIRIEGLRQTILEISIDTISLIKSAIKGTLNSKELELKFSSILSKRLKNKDLAFLLKFDERFSIATRDDCRGNEPLVINGEFNSYLQSDGLLSNLTNLVISIKHELLNNPVRKAFADPKYGIALNKLKEVRSNSNLGSSYFKSLPITSEMIELLNLMESKGENYQSNRNLSIKLMNKKLKEERIKKRKRLITKAIAPKCKNKFVFDYDKDSSTWHIVFKGKVIGGKLLKNPKGFILIRTLLTNRKVPHTIESLNNIIQSDYDPDSTKETRFTKAEINSVASDKKYITRHKTIAGLKKLVTKLTEKLDDSTLTDEERENINVRLKKVYEELTVLEDNASIFKQQNDRVRKQIVDSLKTLNGFSTKLWKHLNASIKKGNGGWVYDPEKPIDWI